MQSQTFFTLIGLLLVAVTTVHSIRCYVCIGNKPDDYDCGSSDPSVLQRHAVDCAIAGDSPALDNKILDRCATLMKDGVTTRSCFYQDDLVGDNTCASVHGAKLCICSTDHCNGGANYSVSN